MILINVARRIQITTLRSRITPLTRVTRCSSVFTTSVKLSPIRFISRVASRRASTTASPGKKPIFPERLIIYHAGTGRTTFLACLKLTTIFVFCFFTIVVTPAYISANDPLQAAGVFLCGTIPLLIVAWTSSPFVAWVHLRLPPYARQSREVLARFARTMPPNTRLQITTMNLIGKPRVSDMTVADLQPVSERLGMVNYARDTRLANAARPWWMFRAVGKFHIQLPPQQQATGAGAGGGNAPEGWVWREIAAGIEKRQQQQQQHTK